MLMYISVPDWAAQLFGKELHPTKQQEKQGRPR